MQSFQLKLEAAENHAVMMYAPLISGGEGG